MTKHLSKKQLVGTTSWLVPGTYYENAKLVAGKVDFVELLVYTWDEQTHDLVSTELDKLHHLTQEYGLLYTLHLPTDNIKNVSATYAYFKSSKLQILNYILHPMPGIEQFLSFNGAEISLENLKEEIFYHEHMVFDVGHHLLGKNFDKKYIKNVKEIHLMGVERGLDHLKIDEPTLHKVWEIFGDDLKRVQLLCIEVFDFRVMIESLEVLRDFLMKR